MKSDHILVFDIGGTHLRCGLYNPTQDKLLHSTCIQTPSYVCFPELPQDVLRARLYDAMRDVAAQMGLQTPNVVSVAFAGPVDREGTVLRAPTIWGPGAIPEPVVDRLNELWPTARVLVANDVSAAGFCFSRSPNEEFCVVTVSSGIGHKIFIGGSPITGRGGQGGEIGHLRVDFSHEAPRCDCGGVGHLGAVASGRASRYQAARLIHEDPHAFAESVLGRAVGGNPEDLDNMKIASTFRAGDAWSERLIRAMAWPLGRALAGIHLAVGVERFVLMGGFAAALGPRYLDLIAEAAHESGWHEKKSWRRMLELRQSGDEAGLLGAGRMAVRCPLSNSDVTFARSRA